MNCEEMRKSVPLYFYGELPPEEEERLEDHLDGCEACRGELERLRALAAALKRREMPAPEPLLHECRRNLMAAVHSVTVGRTPGSARDARVPQPVLFDARPSGSWGTRADLGVRPTPARPSLRERVSAFFAALWELKQPIGAVALLAIGYFSAQLTAPVPRPGPAGDAGDAVVARIRSVQPDAGGHVQIALDEVRRRVVSGRMDDDRIQRLLLAAARDENNAGLRVESVDILKNHAASAEVRSALLNSVANDPNAGVRLKALEGLKGFAADETVRQTMAQLLLHDDNPGVRVQAIDILTARQDESMVGVLQNVVGKEDNSYVRWRCEKALKEMNASVGTF